MTKTELREQIWTALQDAGAARFPGVRGRIPNFVGAEAAAAHLEAQEIWRAARRIKCNPDSPQRSARHRALKAGKIVYLAVPKLAAEQPFLELDPARIPAGSLWSASSIKGASEWGVPLGPEALPRLDLILTGCVAVTRQGARLGKGGGYSDLEYAVLRELGAVNEHTPIVTTVHAVQVVDEIPMVANDISLDGFATPEGWIHCERAFPRPTGVDDALLSDEKRAAIPVLRRR